MAASCMVCNATIPDGAKMCAPCITCPVCEMVGFAMTNHNHKTGLIISRCQNCLKRWEMREFRLTGGKQ